MNLRSSKEDNSRNVKSERNLQTILQAMHNERNKRPNMRNRKKEPTDWFLAIDEMFDDVPVFLSSFGLFCFCIKNSNLSNNDMLKLFIHLF